MKETTNRLAQITTAQLAAMQVAGEFVVIGEFRMSSPEVINYTSKRDGKAMKFAKVNHTVEIGNKAVIVSEGMADDWNPLGYVNPIAKGSRVAVFFTRLETEKGVCQVSGYLVPVVSVTSAK